MYETNREMEHLLKKKIREVLDRGDVSPSEMDCIKDAYETLQAIATIEAMDKYGENQSMRRMSYRDGNMSYGWDTDPYYNESMRRGRGADGRYTSGHSANDKMIASLEKALGDASSDYERQQIMDEIHRLRNAKD